MLLLKKLLCGIFIFACSAVYAEEYIIHKIHVSGLQRVSLETVMSYLPVRQGDRIDTSQTSDIIRALYKTNFFSNISLKRSGNDLLIKVVERSVIGSITFSGNNKVSKKQMTNVLREAGLVDGQVLDQALLNAVVHGVTQLYYSLGLYDVKITTSMKQQDRNRVAVAINIKEGPVAKIKAIRIIGNKAFSENTLLREMSLTTTKLWSFFTDSDKYSEEKLAADLEKLRFYYMDRGYINFKVDSKRVSITPDKKHIYITIHVVEGMIYKISGFSLEGNLIGKRAEILKLITLKVGDTFSRKAIIETRENIGNFLGNYGYGMPNINFEPVVDDNHRRVFIKVVIDAGKRVYVHRIHFSGNNKTHDEVLRREMRQQEGSVFSLAKIERSKQALANLGYLQDINYTIMPVQNATDQVDLTYTVKETSAISADIRGGYSDADGFLYGASLTDNNVFGTGKMVSLRLDNSKASQSYGIGYTDPYFTSNHISFSLKGYLHKDNLAKLKDISTYSISTYGADAVFGIPLSDYSRAAFGLGVEHIKLTEPSAPSDRVAAFFNKYGDPNSSLAEFNQFKVIGNWSYDNFNKIPFTTQGFSQGLGLEVYAPLNRKSLEFYKINHSTSWYQPLFKDFIFHTNTAIGYGNHFGRTKDFPIFKNFFVGGLGTVRGFEAGNLGDHDNLNHAIGGNVMAVASASIIIPTPIKDTMRTSIFIDVGNAYNDRFKLGDLRSSYGIQVEWRTPFGAPLTFCLAKPIRKKDSDRAQLFDFTIGFGT